MNNKVQRIGNIVHPYVTSYTTDQKQHTTRTNNTETIRAT